MLSRTMLFIGVHFLCVTNIAQALMLLTANMEDIKKIARKFLSENIAESIAEFIVKATGTGNNASISEENDENAEKIEVVSGENKNRVFEYTKAATKPVAPVNKEETSIYFQRKDNNDPVFNKPMFQPDSLATKVTEGRTKRYKTKTTTGTTFYEAFNTDFLNDIISKLSEDRRKSDGLKYSRDIAMNYPKEDGSVEHVKRNLVATSGPIGLHKMQK